MNLKRERIKLDELAASLDSFIAISTAGVNAEAANMAMCLIAIQIDAIENLGARFDEAINKVNHKEVWKQYLAMWYAETRNTQDFDEERLERLAWRLWQCFKKVNITSKELAQAMYRVMQAYDSHLANEASALKVQQWRENQGL